MQTVSQALLTCSDIFNFIAPYAGGSVPSETSKQYANWIRWVGVKQDEYAKRGYWRRLLKKTSVSVAEGESTYILPEDFNRANGLYVFDVEGTDWAEQGQDKFFVSMITDDEDEDFGRWQMEFYEELDQDITATMWYFSTPPKPTSSSDKVLLPGDMIAFGVLSEYFRSTGAEGSQDDARNEAEQRFNSYLSQEIIPAKYELIKFQARPKKIYNHIARAYYASRHNRY